LPQLRFEIQTLRDVTGVTMHDLAGNDRMQ
jgi:hypothetical protein